MWLRAIGDDVGLSGLSDAGEGVSAEAHDPAEEQAGGGVEGRVGERPGQSIDDGPEGVDHVPHEGTCPSRRGTHPQR